MASMIKLERLAQFDHYHFFVLLWSLYMKMYEDTLDHRRNDVAVARYKVLTSFLIISIDYLVEQDQSVSRNVEKLFKRTAAKRSNVPASTIRRHRRDSSLRPHVGRLCYLTSDQETYLLSVFKLLPEYGFSLSAQVALQLTNDYCKA